MALEIAIRSYYAIKKSWLFALTLMSILAFFILRFNEAKAQNLTIKTAHNCDTNAVIYCGVDSVDQLINRYNGGEGHNSAASISHIYSFFGITAGDINAMNDPSDHVQLGWVSKSGRVYDSANQLIATNALTGGRENISGSVREVVDGTVFYTRPPAVSFEQQFLAAYVVTTNNRFDFAVLASCGNPVKATPIPAPAPKTTPVPTPMTPTPTPQPTTTTTNICSGNTTISATDNSSKGGNCSRNNTVVETTTSVTPTPTPTPPVTTTPASTLVNTGPGTAGLALLFLTSSSVGTLLYRRWLRSYYRVK